MKIRAVRKTDIILAAVVIIAAFIAVFAFRAARPEGADVVVTADGEEIRWTRISSATSLRISGRTI